MLKILEENIPSEYRPHFNKRLVSYEDSAPEPVKLHFADGSSATCDILIGADGIKSAVRECMFSDLASKALDETQAADYRRCMKPTWSGIIAYRASSCSATSDSRGAAARGPGGTRTMGGEAIVEMSLEPPFFSESD